MKRKQPLTIVDAGNTAALQPIPSASLMLENPRHERFAQIVASGKSGAAAYREVFGNRKRIDNGVNRIMKIARARIDQLQAAAASEAVLSIAEKRAFLARVVRGAPTDASAENPDCETRAGREGEYYVFPNKLKALELDARLAGELHHHVEIDGEIKIRPLTTEEIRERVLRYSPLLAPPPAGDRN